MSIYVCLDPTQWQLIVNKQTGQWGTEYNQSMDPRPRQDGHEHL